MILLALVQVQTDIYDSTAQERAVCADGKSDQPYRFCLADRKQERARRSLAAALQAARRAAQLQKREIAHLVRTNGGVTLVGDPATVLEASQRAWQRSHRLDCQAVGLASATGNGGTEGVTADEECVADRMLERARFLADTYPTER